LNELQDPDLIQRNMEGSCTWDGPMWMKYAMVGFFLPLWKWFYYAPNTYKELQIAQWVREGKALPADLVQENSVMIKSFVAPHDPSE